MSWLNFFQTLPSHSKVNFGRGINADISPKEEELFYNSSKAFEEHDIFNAYNYFFESLINYTHAKSNHNIIIKREKEGLIFELYQGCAKITGTITQKNLYAEAKIIKSRDASVALKRYILERNYQLTYAKYFSDGEYIKIKFYQDNIMLSPQKIFFPLREIALNTDFDKEHIKSEFSDIVLEDVEHIRAVDEKELKIKYKYLILWIEELETKVLTLPSNDNAGMQSFLYLNILFKIDYLLTPKYKIYQQLSQKIQEYFSNENATVEAKNEELKKYVLKLKELNYEEFNSNFYSAKYTFNSMDKASYNDIVNFITESQTKTRWYKNNRYIQIIPTIYNYIAFYSLYNYGMNPVLRELFHILITIQNTSFFNELASEPLYDLDSQTFFKRAIISKIKKLVQTNQKQFKMLTLSTDSLNFSSMNEFCNSYYNILKDLNFEEI